MNFDRLAQHYDWMEAVTAGSLLQKARTCWLEDLAGRSRILSVGEGHGRFAEACARKWPQAELTCVDASAGMLAKAKARTQGLSDRIKWVNQDMLLWQPIGKYDVIVTCFSLDCSQPEPLKGLIAKLASCATPEAIWLMVDFTIPDRGLLRWRATVVHSLMYWFFQLWVGLPATRLTAPDPYLQLGGFALLKERSFSAGLIRSGVWRRCVHTPERLRQ